MRRYSNMTPSELAATLTTARCRLIPEGETLRVQDPQHALTDDLRQAIREHKAALLALLAQPTPVHDATTPTPAAVAPCPHPHTGRGADARLVCLACFAVCRPGSEA